MKNAKNKQVYDKIYVAYVEDEAMVRQAIAHYINQQQSAEVIIEAGSGEELLQKLERAAILPHICMIDLDLGGISGFDIIDELKRKWPDMKMLVLSGHDHKEYKVTAMSKGANGFISKNNRLSEINQALSDIYQNGITYSMTINPQFVRDVRNGQEELPPLDERELRLVKYITSNMTLQEIARDMHCAVKTLENWRHQLYEKLQVKSKPELIKFALRFGLIKLDNDKSLPHKQPTI